MNQVKLLNTCLGFNILLECQVQQKGPMLEHQLFPFSYFSKDRVLCFIKTLQESEDTEKEERNTEQNENSGYRARLF